MKKIFYSLLFLFFGYSTASAQQVTCGIFTFDVIITPVTCNGNCDGAIQITNISGGTPGYSYTWSPNGNTTPNPVGLCAGAYTVTITDAVNNTCTMTFTVPQPAPIQVFETVTDASCAGCCDGSIVLMPTGGAPPYTYVFTPSGPPINLCPGNYSYCVIDTNGCSTCDTVVVSFSNPITFILTVTPVSCFGSTNGSICVDSLSGGTSPYVYSWNTTPSQNTSCATNLSVGTYIVCVTDSNGTTVCDSANVTQPTPIQVTEIVTDASCSTCCDGSIVLTPTGGTPGYTYTLIDSLGFSFFPPYSNLCPSTYTWCITDANGCITCDTLVLSFPTSIISNNIATNFSIYPNPNNGSFIIDLGDIEKAIIEIYNISGQLILKEALLESITPINLKENSKGIYFVKIETENKVIVRKIAYQ